MWSYIAAKAFLTTRQIELVGKKVFAIKVFNLKNEIFIVYISSLFISNINKVYPFCRAQIALLKVDKTLITVFSKYYDFADVFYPELAAELLKHKKFNNYVINLVNGKQILYGPIYSLELLEVETLKTYIKIILAHSFIRSFKSSANTPIFLFASLMTLFIYALIIEILKI